MKRLSGFTLYEFLIVIGITLIFIGFTAALGNQAIKNGEFDRARETVRNELMAAQTDTMAGTFDASWGVAFSTNAVTRYQGASYASRNTSFDRVVTFGKIITISGTFDVPFTRPRGFTLAPASIVVTDGMHTATTTINAIGAITVQ